MKRTVVVLLSAMAFWAPSMRADVGAECGGIAGKQCGTSEFCTFSISDNACGIGDKSGKCETRPSVCIEQYLPVCGCNGVTYGNTCKAHMAGFSVAHAGACAETSCVQVISCGLKDGKAKEYPTPCAAALDGATDIVLKKCSDVN
ncbi:Kazal-type serine protease inhibitor family protein [Sinorhizobium meliloti]|uniref:hypothetical protein n=2 Tax=Rhizobium meliloti TaxID=382 RepID=UPI0009B779A3